MSKQLNIKIASLIFGRSVELIKSGLFGIISTKKLMQQCLYSIRETEIKKDVGLQLRNYTDSHQK